MSCTRTTPWNSSPVGRPSTTEMATVAWTGVRRVMVPITCGRRRAQVQGQGLSGQEEGRGEGTHDGGRLGDGRGWQVRLDRDDLAARARRESASGRKPVSLLSAGRTLSTCAEGRAKGEGQEEGNAQSRRARRGRPSSRRSSLRGRTSRTCRRRVSRTATRARQSSLRGKRVRGGRGRTLSKGGAGRGRRWAGRAGTCASCCSSSSWRRRRRRTCV